ncbi:MAG: hemolysin family protein [Bacteroidota bacterium]|nr:hemolysin family protein [Bacteroidota bacterium]
MSQILIILALILMNGFFSMAEIAIVSSRKSKLEELSRKGNKSAKLVLDLSESPTYFLSTIQVGITLISILLGVFGGSSIANHLSDVFIKWGIPAPYGYELAVILVVLLITFFSIIIGELFPKRIGLANPEKIAMAIARPIVILSQIGHPFVWLLSTCTEYLVRTFRVQKEQESQDPEDEIRALLEEGTEVGTIDEIEQDIVERVFHLGDQRIEALMTNRNDIIWLDIEDTRENNIAKLTGSLHTAYPVCKKEIDDVIGIIYAKDLLISLLNDSTFDIQKSIKPANLFPNDLTVYQVLGKFKETHSHTGFIVDEYGSIEGIVSITDILDGLVGDITQTDQPEVIHRTDGSWLIDGRLAFFEFLHEFEIDTSDFSQAQFQTMGGFMVHKLKMIPKEGDCFEWAGYRFEIIDMDGNRVDKILLSKL